MDEATIAKKYNILSSILAYHIDLFLLKLYLLREARIG
jgi:hypothetical protein